MTATPSACPMAVFSGFYESPGPLPSGDARGLVPPHRDDHRNGHQSYGPFKLTPSYYINLIGVINVLVYYLPPHDAKGRPPLQRHGFIKSTPLEGRAAPPPWWWYLSVVCAFCAVLSGRRCHSSYVDKYEKDVDKYERITNMVGLLM